MGKRIMSIRAVLLLLLAAGGAAAVMYGIHYFSGQMNAKPKQITVVIKSMEQSMEFWQVLSDGVQVAAKEFGVKVKVVGPPTESDIEEQIAILEQEILARPGAIVMAATDVNRLVPVAEKINQAGIKLLTLDSGINSKLPLSFIATDNIEAGKKAGQAMKELLGGSGRVAIISFVQGTATQIDRELGVRSVLEENEDIDVIGTYYSDGVEQKAFDTTKRLLLEHPDLTGIVGLNETSTVGAGKAIRELGLAGEVKLVGFDSSINEVKLLEEGVMQVTVIQKPFNMGYLSVKAALQTINGEKVPPIIDTGSVVITEQNMYSDENQKLLFPFVDR
ncbi:substrate-binding domain-containing protein [Paenibacillus abyssi]|uniref:LacI family transcriptional regulator n=1 Tax=Paenibacillus abyssi TaxID=1340531 RepID=A0A917FT23_9BACL|nr:substrate-binding domain-containing protein [Paenibacillus abyssi]GGG05910.1 LacI family transcriptional regulator [Paenibacillus abyssi]